MCWAIRSKSGWIKKLSDPEIVAKWREETNGQGLTDMEIEYVLEEISYYKPFCDDSNVVLSAVEQAWQSDELIDAKTLRELKDYVKILEYIPDEFKD